MVEAAHMQQSGQEKGTFFFRTNFMHTVYVERLNRPWKSLMETGKREAVKASARNPVDIVPERNELLFLHSGMVRLYDASARSNGRIMLLMGPQCLLHFAFFEQGEAAFSCRISAEKPVCLYRLRCDDMPQAEFVRLHPELVVNAVHSLARLNLLFLYRAHSFSFSSAGAPVPSSAFLRGAVAPSADPEGYGGAHRRHAGNAVSPAFFPAGEGYRRQT